MTKGNRKHITAIEGDKLIAATKRLSENTFDDADNHRIPLEGG